MTLHPGEESSSIRISLHEVSLGTNPRFEALSYTWATEDGDDRRSSCIECEGGKLLVTKNCEAALRRLRDNDVERIFWIDAICVDQDNTNERNHQVQLMREVYSTAHQVIIWLGDASTDFDDETGQPVSDIYMEYLDLMGSQIAQFREEGKDGSASPFYQKIESEANKFALNKSQPSPLWRGFQDIHNRRWWSRIWVIQEEALSQTAFLVCGAKATPYDSFQFLFEAILYGDGSNSVRLWKFLYESRDHALIRSYARLPYLGSPSMLKNVSRFLILTRRLQASDPRDHVFGLLGISEAMKDALPPPDYSKSAAWLFTEVAKTLMEGQHSIDLLRFASNIETNLTLELPSWVPDWSNPSVLDVSSETGSSRNVYNAARNSKAKFKIYADTQELKALGRCFDNLTQMPITDPESYNRRSTAFDKILGWQASCRLGLSLLSYPTGEAPRDALWRTLCWNFGSRNENPSPNENAELFEDWYVQLMSDKWLEGEVMDPDDPFHNLVDGFLAPVCVTVKGYLASVPYTAKKGDCIAILSGGRVPFVLRPIGSHYRLIGPCYVHGIMNGGAFTDDESEFEWVSIR
jgi:hypothetical protein